MRGGDAELGEQRGNGLGEGGRGGLDVRRERGRGAEPGQVDGDDVEVLGESRDDGIPGRARKSERVQEHERLAGTDAGVRESGHTDMTTMPS